MIGLALSGGGLRGAYEVGVYKALKECHIKIDGFVGTSIGAINAVIMASKQEEKLYDFWINCDAGKILRLTDKLSKEINEGKLDKEMIQELLINGKNILVNKGLSLDGLREVLNDFDLPDKLYKSNKEFGLVTVKVKKMQPLYVFKEDIKPEKLLDYLIASCYLPIFKFEKIIDDNYYLDGGFHDNVPANALIKRGYKKVYVVDLEAIGIKRKYIDASKIIEIKPSHNLGSILNIRQKDIQKNVNLGYYDTLKIIKKLDGYNFIFKKRTKWYYNFLASHASAKTKKEMQVFFKTTDNKELIIKAIEYIMKKEKYNYCCIYNIGDIIKNVKHQAKNYGVYKFINELQKN